MLEAEVVLERPDGVNLGRIEVGDPAHGRGGRARALRRRGRGGFHPQLV